MGKFSTLLHATGLAVSVAMPAWAQDADTVLATVNGRDITLGHVIALQDRLPEQYKELADDTLYRGILDQLIQQTALEQALEKEMTKNVKLGRENEIRAFMAGELLAKVGSSDVPDADVRAAYDEQFKDYVADLEFNASHILVETEEEALAIIEELDGGADFAELAKAKSTGPSGPGGGSLGWFGKGQMVPAFEEAVVALDDGGVSPPIQTQFGWHVVKRFESRAIEAPTLEESRGDIEQLLKSRAIEAAIEDITSTADVVRAEVTIDPKIIRRVDLISEN